jgi:putative transposase
MWQDHRGYIKTRRAINSPGHAHSLTFSCYHRFPLRADDVVRIWFIDALQQLRTKAQIHLWAYVIMPEHAHVLLCPQSTSSDIEELLKSFKQSIARRALAHLRPNSSPWLSRLAGERAGDRIRYHFWQPGGGYDRNIDCPKTAWREVDYIHNNPVRRGLAAGPTDWEWLSARWYAGLPDARIVMDPVT